MCFSISSPLHCSRPTAHYKTSHPVLRMAGVQIVLPVSLSSPDPDAQSPASRVLTQTSTNQISSGERSLSSKVTECILKFTWTHPRELYVDHKKVSERSPKYIDPRSEYRLNALVLGLFRARCRGWKMWLRPLRSWLTLYRRNGTSNSDADETTDRH